MSELRRTYEGVVARDEIDHLGHMNVRWYASRAMHATRALAAEYGLSSDACAERDVLIGVPDAFTRHYREQLVGAPLAVMTGVLSVRETGLRLYHELVNRDSGELAATFVHEARLFDRATRAPRSIPAGLAERAQASAVPWPERGRPRTLDLEKTPTAPTLDVVRARGLESREPRTITAAECDPDGFYEPSFGPELVWGGVPIGERGFRPLQQTSDGRDFGWATLESRNAMTRTPRVGDRIQSFSAEVGIARKTSHRNAWVFDVDTGDLVYASSVVNLAFDVAARRSIEIPPGVRAGLEVDHHPDLA